MKPNINANQALVETPLDRWIKEVQDGEVTLSEMMRYLNAKAENRPNRLRSVSYCLAKIRDSLAA